MAYIKYEFPLNEKVRTYLRIEHLIQRMHASARNLDEKSLLHFFESLFAVAEVIERGDLRGDLLKDLEKHEKNLVSWSQHPDIDSSAINGLIQQVMNATNNLTKSGRLGIELKEDKFLGSIKQRFAIPGGTCCFDLPHLHFWLHTARETQQADIEKWLSYLKTLEQVVGLELKFVRESGRVQQAIAEGGSFQDATGNTELIQIQLEQHFKAYPTVSGNKHRFSIRFMQLCPEQGKAACEQDIPFTLVCC
ncbi:cell division protein ZapD [Saccharobesus litoralis]|uniref:Cell division protein ZapD n=1 Tax=Saccharobesus litoralis TaxID=2172099 RepID=A0A2S0VWY7_9ALTE|nr:cell division protein ZapD [Saccharobesus litoralis]AWB68729.1 cell division protein ZapD [Saccharobesus litoralis]